MKAADLKALRAMEAEGTQTPWLPYSRRGGEREAMIRAAGRDLFLGVDDEQHPELNTGIDADTCLAAAARNALPVLLREREELLKALKAVMAEMEDPAWRQSFVDAEAAIAKAES